MKPIDAEIARLVAMGYDHYGEPGVESSFRRALLDHDLVADDTFTMILEGQNYAVVRLLWQGAKEAVFTVAIELPRWLLAADEATLRTELRARIREGVRMGAKAIPVRAQETDAWTQPRNVRDLLGRLA